MKKTVCWLLAITTITLIPVKSYSKTLGFYGFTEESISLNLRSEDKNKSENFEETRTYCLDLLNRFGSIISAKSYDSLTEKEKETVKEFIFTFSQMGLCTSALWESYTKKSNLDLDKLSENKLSLLTTSWKTSKKQSVDILPALDQIVSECSNAISLPQKIKCIVNSGTFIDRGIGIPTFIIPLLIKVKNPDKVDILVYELSSPVSIKKYKKQLEKIEKNPEDKALCIYDLDITRPFSHSLKMTCPFLHLEKDFGELSLFHSYFSPSLSLFVLYTSETPEYYQSDINPENKQVRDNPILKQILSELTEIENTKLSDKSFGLKEWLKKTEQINTKNYCLVKVKEVRTNVFPFYIAKDAGKNECIEEIVKYYYESIRKQYMWLEKELKPRGYLN